jgi:HD-GYP domain-containing protein (c-di-GMP phosphodiesterase class II)
MTVWRMRLVRAGLGAAIAASTKLVGLTGQEIPVLGLLGTTSLSFVVGSAVFGWFGLLGASLLHVGWTIVRSLLTHGASGASLSAGELLLYPVTSTVLYFLAGAAVLEAFRRVEGIGRAFPNLRSLGWYCAATGTGALLTSCGLSAIFDPSTFWANATVWGRSTLVSVWVFGPALLILGKRLPAGWPAPIPGEEEDPHPGRFTLRGTAADREMEVVREPDPVALLDLLVGTIGLVCVAVVSLQLGRYSEGAGHWAALLYLVPIYWATRRHRLVGGLVAAAGTGLALVAGEAIEHSRSATLSSVDRQLDVYVYLLVFLAVGALLGHARNREIVLLEALRASNRRLRSDLNRVVRALTGAVEAKDVYTEGHLQRVSSYALEVGSRLGLTAAELGHLRIASALHDVGKIGVPEHILNKPGPLDEHERAIIERHPEIGARILDAVDGLSDAAPLVLHHQERWDGRRDSRYPGYPHGIDGETIPLGARIIAVVDAFDAMTTDRAYRRALPLESAVTELRSERGGQFDPRVVDVFLEILDRRPWD